MNEKPMPGSVAVLTGQTESHLVKDPTLDCLLHAEVVEPIARLRQTAHLAGFDLAVASSFRSFSRQCTIWNDKVLGRRSVLDDKGNPIDLGQLDDWGKVQAILRWSALPGASRHHWGTDLDVFDRNGLSADHPEPALTVAECARGGPFHAFHRWLSQTLQREQGCNFYRPYAVDRGGVGCEPWHISYRPIAIRYQQMVSRDLLFAVISDSDIALRDTVLTHLDAIYQRYVALPAN
jgi:LAS superfamily LD-carboxypeptidase LdcB